MSMRFGEDFLFDHAKTMVTDPKVAIMELLANCSDAGSLNVKIKWPLKVNQELVVEDDGTGLTFDEFMLRWETLSFQRRKEIGKEVIFPEDTPKPWPKRKLFGKSGKGRHSSFCFSEIYTVTTCKDGKENQFAVKKSKTPDKPFDVEVIKKDVTKERHGTKISLTASKGIDLLPLDDLKELIGTKFLMDPSLSVFINDEKVKFDDLSTFKSDMIELEGIGTAEIIFIDSAQKERSTRLRGLVWWVNNRMVGSSTSGAWRNIITDKDHLDGRSRAAKKYGFVIKVDFLDDHVESDWQGFQKSETTRKTGEAIDNYLQDKITSLLESERGESRKNAIESNKHVFKDLTPVSQIRVSDFIDAVQRECPTIKESDLVNTSKIFANLEKSRSGYDLLKQLADCSPNDLDRWNTIISKWDSRWVQIVIDEIDSRVTLINEMEKLVHDKKTDELHELQPLFEKGLWIFGPQYESIEFVSNVTLKTIVNQFLAGDKAKLDNAKKRPDLVTAPIGAWESNLYDDEGNVLRADKVLIIELKKGGFTIKQKEIDQARDYAIALKKTSSVDKETKIECFVLGSKLDQYVSSQRNDEQNIYVIPKTYENVLRQANARLFNLRKKIERIAPVNVPDDIKNSVAQVALNLQH